MNTKNNGCRLESFQSIGNESKRLVDPKRFIDFLRESKVKETGAFSKGINKGLNIAISALGNDQIVPPVDAAEVVHGRWDKYTDERFNGYDANGRIKYRKVRTYYCDKCDHGSAVKANYCPNCGAKMDGDG